MAVTITAAANLSSPVSDALEWSACQDLGGIDPATGDHYQFRAQQGSTAIQLYTSQNNGGTFGLTASDATTPYTGGLHGLLCLDQDTTNGAVHMVLYNATGITSAMGYGRVTFTTSGGHITGYTWARTPVNLTNHSTSNFDPRGQIRVFTIGGAECIVYLISRGSNSGTNLRYYAGLSTSLTPSSSTSFTGIDTTGSDTVMVNMTDATGVRSCHTFCCAIGQNKTTEDLVLFCGHVFSGDLLNTPSGSLSDLWYKLLVRSGGGWTAPTSTTAGTAVVATNGTSTPDICCVRSHTNGAYVMYNDPANGIKYAYINSTPAQTTISGSPLSTANRGGYGTFNVDASGNIVSVYKTEGVNGASPVCGEAYYISSSWTNTNDTATQDVLAIHGTCNGTNACSAALVEGDSIAQTVPGTNVVKVATVYNAPSSNNTIAVPAGSLSLTGFAPTIVTTANNVVAVPSGTLTLSGKVPTVTATNNQTVAVPAGSLTLSGQVPTVISTSNQFVLVPAGSLTLTGFAPTVVVTANNIVGVPLGTLTLTGFAPIIQNGANQVIGVPAGSLSLTANAPTIVQTANNVISVPLATLSITANIPIVAQTANQFIDVPAGSLGLTGYAPVVTVANGDRLIDVPLAQLVITGFAPTVKNGDDSGGDDRRRKKTRNAIRNGKFVQEKVPQWPFEQQQTPSQQSAVMPQTMTGVQSDPDRDTVSAIAALMMELL